MDQSGLGDLDSTSGAGNDIRFDFASMGILPDGGSVIAYHDSSDPDPLFAVETLLPANIYHQKLKVPVEKGKRVVLSLELITLIAVASFIAAALTVPAGFGLSTILTPSCSSLYRLTRLLR